MPLLCSVLLTTDQLADHIALKLHSPHLLRPYCILQSSVCRAAWKGGAALGGTAGEGWNCWMAASKGEPLLVNDVLISFDEGQGVGESQVKDLCIAKLPGWRGLAPGSLEVLGLPHPSPPPRCI